MATPAAPDQAGARATKAASTVMTNDQNAGADGDPGTDNVSRTGTVGCAGASSSPLQDASPADFQAWLAPHWAAMQRLAERMGPPRDAEDVLQEAVTRAWQRRADFDPARGAPRSWLLAIVADQSAKATRRTWRLIPAAEPADGNDAAAPTASADLDLRSAVGALPDRQRTAIALFYYLDLSLADAAAAMSCSVGTVKSTLWAARAALRDLLGETS
ncbi:RNA polymerase sigma factor [Nakamurella aerolata]|nr:sigma-70 family RNA polymerase sigma factor [Nakamurella aerolata]